MEKGNIEVLVSVIVMAIFGLFMGYLSSNSLTPVEECILEKSQGELYNKPANIIAAYCKRITTPKEVYN